MLAVFLWLVLPALAGDRDGDGLPNKVDACRDLPEDFDGWQDHDGCPDRDNDIDGIPDVDDACPDEEEDEDGVQDEDGCPDLDDDEDGVPNDADACLLEPEDAKGDPLDGCPEVDAATLTGGWMAAVGELAGIALATAGGQGEGCAEGAAQAQAWLAAHDPAHERAVFEARLGRLPDGLEAQTFRTMLDDKASSYPMARKALAYFCRDDAAWQGVQGAVDAVLSGETPTP